LERYARELTGCARLAGSDEHAFWQAVREAPAEHTRRRPNGVILRISTALSEMGDLLRLSAGACIVRAGNGIAYLYLDGWREAVPLLRTASERHWSLAVEYAPDDARQKQELWPASAQTEEAFAIMKSVKQMFDPHNLLNRSRLYGRL
jgi:FAD/FMN-containing dehydrogenase